MNKAVALVLNRVLGDWLEGIDSSSFNLSLLSGEVKLGPIQIRPDAINRLGFPFTLRCGFVNKIIVKVPVLSLGSKQMVIEVDGVYIYASPRPHDDWNPETEIANQKKAKQGELSNFELMNREQMPQDPGFVGKLVKKIIDNLQIKVSGVCFRYVDSISSSVPFAVGVILKRMELFTCNDRWEMEFREDPKVTLKKIQIEHFAMFLDYSATDNIRLSGKDERAAFEQLAKTETAASSNIPHRFIIHPLFLEVRAKLGKDPSDLSIPQVEASINLGNKETPFRFAFEAPQATHLIRCGEFFGEFKTFQNGVLSKHDAGPFRDDEGHAYRDVYKQWRAFVLAEKTKKADALVPSLESFEDQHTFDDIAKQRKAALVEMENEEEVKALNSQLSQLSEPVSEGKVSKLKGYVGWGPSDGEKKQKEEERKMERERVTESLRVAKEKKAKLQAEVESILAEDSSVSAISTDKSYNRLKLYLTIREYIFDIGGENKVYLHMAIEKMQISTIMRATTMDVSFSLKNFKIEDKLLTDTLYPCVMETTEMKLELKQPPEGKGSLLLRTDKLRAVANVECLLGLAGEFMRAMSGLLDIRAISSSATHKSQQYMELGKQYMSKAVTGKYERHPLDLDVQMGAPCIIIPYDLRSPRDRLVIDFGRICASTDLAIEQPPGFDYTSTCDKLILYDRYKFSLKSALIYTESSEDDAQTPIFEPQGVELNARVCVIPSHPQMPALEVYVKNGEVPLRFSDMQFLLVLKIKDKVMKELAANMPAKFQTRPPTKEEKTIEKAKSLEELPAESQEPAKLLCQHFYILFEKFTIDLYSKGVQVFNFTMINSLLVATLTPEGAIIIDYKLDEIFASDMRPGVQWNRILGDPIVKRSKQDEQGEGNSFLAYIQQEKVREVHNSESEQFPAKDCDFFVRLAVLENAQDIKGVVRLGEMCVTVNPDSLQSLLEIPQEAFRKLAASKPAVEEPPLSPRSATIRHTATFFTGTMENKITTKTKSKRSIDMRVLVDSAELRLPLQSNDMNSKVFSFYVETDMYYRASEEYEYGLNAVHKVLSTTPISVHKDARIDVYKVGMIIGRGSVDSDIKGLDNEKGDLIQPCRMTLGYNQDWITEGEENFMRNTVEMSLETFELVVGFRDLDFFKRLGARWAQPEAAKPQRKPPLHASSPSVDLDSLQQKKTVDLNSWKNEFVVDFKTECIQIDLCDDTRRTLIPLTRGQIGNMSAQIVYSDREFTLSFAGSTETNYYNSLVASWEPLLEFWTFELVASPQPMKIEEGKEKAEEAKADGEGQSSHKYIQFEGIQPLYLQFKGTTPFRVNVTYSMVHTLSVMLKTIGEDSNTWEPEHHSGGTEGTAKQLTASKLEYKFKNRTGEEFHARIDGGEVENGQFTLENGGTHNISQSIFEKAAGRTQSLQRYNALLQTPQFPCNLTIRMSDSSLVSGVSMDKVGLYAYKSSSGIPLIVEVLPKIGHVTIRTESCFKLANNTVQSVVLGLEGGDETVEIGPEKATSVPISWTKDLSKVVLKTDFGDVKIRPSEDEERKEAGEEEHHVRSLKLSENTFVVVDSVLLSAKNFERSQEIVLLNPPLRVQNYLPASLLLQINSEDPAFQSRAEPGEEIRIYHLDPTAKNTYKWTLELGEGRGTIYTDFIKLKHDEEQHFRLQGDMPCDKLSFSYKKKAKFNASRDCDIVFRQCEKEDFHGVLLAVYNQFWIVNHTDFPLDFTGKKDYLRIGPHTIGMVKTKQESLQVRLSDREGGYGVLSEFSQKFNITTTGVAGLIKLPIPESAVKQGKPMEVNLGLLIEAGKKPIMKSTIIHIYPRYVLTNYTNRTLFVRQHNTEGAIETLDPKQSLSYQVPISTKPKNIQISSDQCHWSSPFNLDEIEDFQVRFTVPESEQVRGGKWWEASESNNSMVYTRVAVTTETEATLFVSFLEPADPEILIKNESNSPIAISQVDATQCISLPPHSQLPFTYDNRLISVKRVLFKSPAAERTYIIDKMKDVQKPLGDLSVSVEPDLSSRVVIIREKSQSSDSQNEMKLIASTNRFANINLALFFPGFELSLHDEVPAERFLLTVMNIRVKVKVSDGARTEPPNKDGVEITRHAKQLAVKLSIQHIQLDNMSTGTHEYPIIFGGTDHCAATPAQFQKDSSTPITPFIQIGVIKDHIETLRALPNSRPTLTSAFDRFTYMNVTIQEMQTRVHQDTVNGLLAVFAKLQSGFAEDPTLARRFSKKISATVEEVCTNLKAEAPVLSYDLEATASKIYVSALQLNALKILLSFKTGRKPELDLGVSSGFGIFSLLARVGGAFITITDSTLHFSSVIICDSFQTQSSLIGLIVKNYIKQGILQFYRIIGSSDLIGNPIGLIDKLGTGVFEFFSEPVKGLMKASPKEFAMGVGKGVRSLVTSVVSGSFGSVSKITGSLYTVVREVGGDEESANRINATDTVAEGVFHGVKGGIVDLAEGVTGVFTKPWKGAKSGGVKGFFKGVGSGVVGAVVAPLSAVLRVSASVTSSVVAQTMLLDDKIKQAGRMRYPRQFGARKVMETYSHSLAQAQNVLSSRKEFQNQELVFYQCLAPHEHVILTQHTLFYVEKYEIAAAISLRSLEKVIVDKLPAATKKGKFRMIAKGPGEHLIILCQEFRHLAKLFRALKIVEHILKTLKTEENRDRLV